MWKRILIVVAVVVAFAGMITLFNLNTGEPESVDKLYKVSSESGNIGEKVFGNPDTAKVVLYEYADFGCSHCAAWNKVINELLEKYDGKLALVFRNYDIGFQNGGVAAQAATAAHVQGYFKEYKDLLFNNQSEWFYEDDAKLAEIFSEYFVTASDGKGDLDKFRADVDSSNVKKRLEFEQNLGKKAGVSGTPTFRIDGEKIELSELLDLIENKISE